MVIPHDSHCRLLGQAQDVRWSLAYLMPQSIRFSGLTAAVIAVAQNDMHGASAISAASIRLPVQCFVSNLVVYARCQPSASKSIGITLGIDSHVSQAANFTG